jgi:hypothetical protein
MAKFQSCRNGGSEGAAGGQQSGGDQLRKLPYSFKISCLRSLAVLWYKQWIESICVAGWALFCNSRARPASKMLRRLRLQVVPATGLNSETIISQGDIGF